MEKRLESISVNSGLRGEEEVHSDDVKEVDSASMLGLHRRSIGEDFQELVQPTQGFESQEIADKNSELSEEEFGKENGARDSEGQRSSKGHPHKNNKDDLFQKGDTRRIRLDRDRDMSKATERAKRDSVVTKKVSSQAGDWNPRPGRTIPRPFMFATDRRATIARIADAEADAQTRTKSDAQLYQASPKIIAKASINNSLNEDVMKYGRESKSSKPVQPNYEKKDARSIPLAQSFSKVKGNNFTRSVSFSFISEERLQKRKEFYEKLEEKHEAMEQEKNLMVEKTKEQVEAEIKELRKNLIIRANPVPSFYQEGLPPKPKLKKIPTTRAKSPNFTKRRNPDRHCFSSRCYRNGHECVCCPPSPLPLLTKPPTERNHYTKALPESSPDRRPVRRSLMETLAKTPAENDKTSGFHLPLPNDAPKSSFTKDVQLDSIQDLVYQPPMDVDDKLRIDERREDFQE